MTAPTSTPAPTPTPDPAAKRGLWSRLYQGDTDFDIVGRWKIWFALSGLLVLASLGSLAVKGLNLGIDFTGGSVWEVPAGDADVADIAPAMAELGYQDVQVQEITQPDGNRIARFFRVEAEASASPDEETTEALDAVAADLDDLADEADGDAADELAGVQTRAADLQGPFEEPVPAQLVELQALVDGGDADADELRALVDQLEDLQQAEQERLGLAVTERLAEITGSTVADITVDRVGPSWGQQITDQARTALIVFLLAVMAYITLRFEFKMAAATVAALLHDLIVVVGVYSIFSLPVTPATVIALLTILGFSIYDGIVVFDRVDENTPMASKKGKLTYTAMANRSLNQVLMRSLNTSITALLPILSILVVGSVVLGEATLQEFGVALFLGVLAGAYSSLFVATPMLALLKEREPEYREVREVLAGRQRSSSSSAPAKEAVPASVGAAATPTSAASPVDPITPRPRKQGRRR